MRPAHPLFPSKLIDCVAEQAPLNIHELDGFAERIWAEGTGAASVFAWRELAPDSIERARTLRVALVAAYGAAAE